MAIARPDQSNIAEVRLCRALPKASIVVVVRAGNPNRISCELDEMEAVTTSRAPADTHDLTFPFAGLQRSTRQWTSLGRLGERKLAGQRPDSREQRSFGGDARSGDGVESAFSARYSRDAEVIRKFFAPPKYVL